MYKCNWPSLCKEVIPSNVLIISSDVNDILSPSKNNLYSLYENQNGSYDYSLSFLSEDLHLMSSERKALLISSLGSEMS